MSQSDENSFSKLGLEAMSDKERLDIEYEFVQNLANVGYLHYLAQEKYLEDEGFINFLKYLRYWKQPEYLVHIRFPHCLAFLDALIDNDQFRKEIARVEFRDFVHQQQAKHWMQGLDVFSEERKDKAQAE